MKLTKHNDYEKIVNTTSFIYSIFKGGRGLLDRDDFIIKHPDEKESVYNTRRQRAGIYNYLRPIVNNLSFPISTMNIKRNLENDLLIEFSKTATKNGNSLKSIMDTINKYLTMIRFGVMVDFTKEQIITTKKELLNSKNLPYIKIIMPELIEDWYFDDFGLAWILLHEKYQDKSNPDNIKDIDRYIRWTRTGYIEGIKVKDKVIWSDEVLHNLGEIPIKLVNYQITDTFKEFMSTIEEIALLTRRICNHQSCIDENIYTTIYSKIGIPIGEYADVVKASLEEQQKQSGKSNIFFYEKGGVPQLVRNDLINIPQIMAVIQSDIQESYRLAGISQQSRENFEAQSGASKEYDFEFYYDVLSYKCSELECIENWIIKLAGIYLNQEVKDEEKTAYPTFDDFQIKGITDKLKIDMDSITASISESFTKYAKKQYVSNAYPKLQESEPELFNKIIQEIETKKQGVLNE